MKNSPKIKNSPVVTIYQNNNFVSGLLQQLAEFGLLTTGEYEQTTNHDHEDNGGRSGNLGASAGGVLPGIGSATANLGGNLQHLHRDSIEERQANRSQYTFTQAYHLHLAQKKLEENGLVTRANSLSGVNRMNPGDFVVFSGPFLANEVGAILDVFSPRLIEAIVRYLGKSEASKLFETEENYELRKQHIHQRLAKANNDAEFAHEIASAVAADFRSDETREFYCTIGSGDDIITMVTVCDQASFLTGDRDRILDGEFTVLGKVASRVGKDVPLLERNKLLRRLNPDLVDWMMKSLAELPKQSAISKIEVDGEGYQGEIVDTNFTGRLRGASVKVLPIAIYV